MEVILIVGLPGSGKTYLINTAYKTKKTYSTFDDVKRNAVLDCGDFTHSIYYPSIIKEMNAGKKNIVISDISFCIFEEFIKAYKILNWWISQNNLNYKIKTIVFKNELAKCNKNIYRDKNRYIPKRIQSAKSFSGKFNIDKFNEMNISLKDVYEE